MSYFTAFPKIKYNGKLVTDITKRVKIKEYLESDPTIFMPYTLTDDMRPDELAYFYYGDSNLSWLIFLANNIINPYFEWTLPVADFDRNINKKYSKKPIEYTPENMIDGIIHATHEYFTTDPIFIDDSPFYVIRIDDEHFKVATTIENAKNGISTMPPAFGTVTRNIMEFLHSTNIHTNVIEVSNGDINITYDTYLFDDSIVKNEWTLKRVYEYELDQNERHRTIWLINKDYADTITNELRKLMNE